MPISAFNRFNQFPEDLMKGVHNFTSDATASVKVALCATANAPVAGNSVLADLTQIAYTFVSSRQLTGITAEQTNGVCPLTCNDLTLTATGGSFAFRYVALFNDTTTAPVDALIGWYDYGATVTLLDGESILLDIASVILNTTVS